MKPLFFPCHQKRNTGAPLRSRVCCLALLVGGLDGWAAVGQAQSQWINYTNVHRVYEIVPDGDQVWFGTEGGLKRFDRVTSEWTLVTAAEGLPHNHINAIATDFRSVWAGSRRGGLACLDRAQGKWDPVSVDKGLPAQQRILALALDGEELWVGTDGAGIARYDTPTEEWTSYTKASTHDGLQSDVIYDLEVTRPAIWAATGFGLARFDRATKEWITYRPPNSALDGRLDRIAVSDDRVWVATEKRGAAMFNAATKILQEYAAQPNLGEGRYHALASLPGTVWLGSSRGLLRMDTAQEGWQPVPETPWYVTALGVTPEELWVATASDGIRRYDFLEQTWTAFPETDVLPGNHVTCVATTPTATWFGLSDQGVFRLDRATETWDRFSVADGLPSPAVRAMVTLGEEVWCATPAGVGYYDGKTGPWQALTTETTDGGLVSDNVTSLLLHDNLLWVAGAGGLSSCTPQRTDWHKYVVEDLRATGGFPRLLLDRALDSLWVVGPDRAWRFNRAEPDPQRQWVDFRNAFRPTTLEHAVPGEQLIHSVAIDVTSVWFLCVDGLRQYEKQPRKWWIHDDRAGVPLVNITCLALGPEEVWCGTQDGLFQFDRATREWTEIGREEGQLTAFAITALAFDEELLWIVTKDGVTQYDPRKEEWYHPEADLVAGLHDAFVTPAHLWFAGEGGLSAYVRPGP